MILRLTCPSCQKDSYSPSAEAFKPCPYCGIAYSGKYGTERRQEDRIEKPVDLTVSYKGSGLDANIVNFSKSGLTLRIPASPVLPLGDIMDVHWMDSNLRARIMWVMQEPYSVVTGLKVLDGGVDLMVTT